MNDLERMSVEAPENQAALALASIAVGDHDRAYIHLERAISQRNAERIALSEIKSNYWGDPVLEEPRFRALRDRISAN